MISPFPGMDPYLEGDVPLSAEKVAWLKRRLKTRPG